VSFLGSLGGARRASAKLLRHRTIAATTGAAAAVIVAGCTFAATSTPASGQAKLAGDSNPAGNSSTSSAAAGPLQLLSASPTGGIKDANGGAPITLTFSSALSPTTPLPAITPQTAGSWKVSGKTATFTPASGILPDTSVTVKVPVTMSGASSSAGTLARSSSFTYTTGSYSTLRLQQLLAELGYLPLTWTATTPGAGAVGGTVDEQASDAYDPPAGTLTFQAGYPTELTSRWKLGASNLLNTGAIRAFESDQGLTMDGEAGPEVWAHLLAAAAKDQVNPNGYTYALATQNSPNETLRVWHNGKVILDTAANTGIAGANTEDGTFPVYERLKFQVMKGTNLDGTKYADPVYWISYFNAGDAVHYFDRDSYGSYQSLGCVELPMTQAKFIWPYLTYGTLVTVTGPVA
jgi:peptidoglycan hydrolase-like protein with peptidoglycan-binding domain